MDENLMLMRDYCDTKMSMINSTIESYAGQTRSFEEKIKEVQLFMGERESDEKMMQTILTSFKDRIIDKFKISTEEFLKN